MSKPVILTGLRANNDLHIGNYFGAMLPMIDMAKRRSSDYQINMFIPDLHSFTTSIDHTKLYEQILHTARLFVAAGLPLNDENIHLYRQSYVSAHSELTWILDCFTGFGEMSRMTQFKDKSTLVISDTEWRNDMFGNPKYANDKYTDANVYLESKGKEVKDRVSVGLFNYPVLMASDILLYNAKYIPVGDDQTQHLEFTRDIAERMNNRFGELFTVAESVKKQHEFFGSSRGSEDKEHQGLRIMDLADPTKKMSKSDDTGKGVIFLGDDPEIAAKKIMSATTDDKALVAYDPLEQPGISNLLTILALLTGNSLESVIEAHAGQQKYGDFKAEVAEQMKQFLLNFQTNLSQVNDDAMLAKLESSELAMNEQANATLLKVQCAVGLRPKE